MTQTKTPSHKTREVHHAQHAHGPALPSREDIKKELHSAFTQFFPHPRDQHSFNVFLDHMHRFIDGETKSVGRHK